MPLSHITADNMFKIMKTWQIYFVVAIALLVVDWAIAMARFHYSVFRTVFAVINFPTSIAYLWLEKKPNNWWHGIFGSLIGDEVGQFISFLLMIALQSLLITVLFLLLKRWRSQSNIVVNRN